MHCAQLPSHDSKRSTDGKAVDAHGTSRLVGQVVERCFLLQLGNVGLYRVQDCGIGGFGPGQEYVNGRVPQHGLR